MNLLLLTTICVLCALATANPHDDITIDELRCQPGWVYHAEKCYKLHPRVIYKPQDKELCKFDYTAADIATIENQSDQLFLEQLAFKNYSTKKPVIINAPKKKKNSTEEPFGNWMTGEPINAKKDHCVSLDFANGTQGQWYINNECVGHLLCVKVAKPMLGDSGAPHSIAPNATTEESPATDHNNTTDYNNTTELKIDDQNAKANEVSEASPVKDQDDEEIAAVPMLVFMFVLACLIICFVLIFAYRLRKKAQRIGLEQNQYDGQMYCDKREIKGEPEEEREPDVVLFDRKTLNG